MEKLPQNVLLLENFLLNVVNIFAVFSKHLKDALQVNTGRDREIDKLITLQYKLSPIYLPTHTYND